MTERTAETAEELAEGVREPLRLALAPIAPALSDLAELVRRASDRDAWEATATELAEVLEAVVVYGDSVKVGRIRAALAVFRERKAGQP